MEPWLRPCGNRGEDVCEEVLLPVRGIWNLAPEAASLGPRGDLCISIHPGDGAKTPGLDGELCIPDHAGDGANNPGLVGVLGTPSDAFRPGLFENRPRGEPAG